MTPDIVRRFQDLLDRARQTSLREPTAVTLATANSRGEPSARVVLLRGFDERGFVFYSNTLSAKGQQLGENPRAALCFHWDELAEQVRVEGPVAFVSDAEADAYWAGRSRESQIGAWASLQSRTLDRRETLIARVAEFVRRFAGRDVPRPDHWTGYRLTPHRIEFWISRPARLHERVVYEKREGSWESSLLFP